ncbi:hypothetical protein ANO11243_061930 [Dothideomycetidae sp. 11243]|nr:hypothetical protein ANO11243_061930 [fungal sp. No.11243]
MSSHTTRVAPDLLQISVSQSAELEAIVPAYRTSLSCRTQELATVRQQIAASCRGATPSFGMLERISPHAIAVSGTALARLEQIHILLGRAFADLTGRWFSDTEAKLPKRMPLSAREESLLRYVGSDSFPLKVSGPPSGCWRSDVLFGTSPDGKDAEFPYICELNGRLPLNGVLMTGLHGTGGSRLAAHNKDVKFTETFDDAVTRIMSCFDSSKPLFIVRDQWPGVDSKVLEKAYTARTAQATRVVRPSDLEVCHDEGSPTGFALWHAPEGERMEQWLCEMVQAEWAVLPELVARQLALTPLNDIRTIFLIHDKRILGILTDELSGMSARGVLTAQEANILRASIPETLIPGSKQLQKVLHNCKNDQSLKNSYIYKPCRDGSGRGVELGRNLSQEEFIARVEKLHDAQPIQSDQGPAVLQRLVEHNWYNIVRHEVPGKPGPEPQKFHLIGSMFMWDCQHFHLGPWRLGAETHLGLATGVVMSAMKRPNFYSLDEKTEESPSRKERVGKISFLRPGIRTSRRRAQESGKPVL